MLAALALSSLLLPDVRKVVLENGTSVDQQLYWGTSDTYLDGTSPQENNGDSHVLEGGPQRTILLKFGDLERLGRCKVVKATLFMAPSAEGSPRLSAIKAVQLPWGEGPLRRPFFTDKPLVASPWSATWNDRHAGTEGMQWQQPGATGPGDAQAIQGATLKDDGKEIEIDGLETAVQNMIDRWYQNNGFELLFSAPTEFFSSKNVTGKPRLELELQNRPAPSGPDLAVTWIEAKYDDPNANPPTVWPKAGSEVTYIAHIGNAGDAPADGFVGAWNVGEKAGSSFDVSKKLAPGEETTVEIKRTFQANTTDHRIQPLGFLITPKGTDADSGDDYVEIQEDAIPLTLEPPKGSDPAFVLPLGAQKEVRRINSVLAESRFSFAPEGSLERFRFGGFGKPTLEAGYDTLLHVGLISYRNMNPEVTEIDGKKVFLNSEDRWPGVLGGGSTANEVSVPGEIQLPYIPNYNDVFDQYELKPTGLLAASDVAALDRNLGKPVHPAETLEKLPGTIIVRALDLDGEPLPNTELRFYQSKDGQVKTDEPAFRLTTGDNGSVLLPTRTAPDGKSDQFGGLLPDGSNGVYLVAATQNGVTDYAWLKAWQLCDSYSRTGKPAVFTEMRFNVPFAEVDQSKNLEEAAEITDSDKDSAESLNALADGDMSKTIELPNKKGDWVEIDLGKDQKVAEIDLAGQSMWPQFDVKTYFSGESINQASDYAHEVDWNFNLATRPQLAEDGTRYLAYRSQGRAVRYIRIVCRQPAEGSKAQVAEIRVFGIKS